MIDLDGVNLEQVVEQAGVDLKRQGANYVGLCPFHNEKNPSFCVFPDNHFKCWGCGAYGDAVTFIRKLHGCDFREALNLLGINNGPLTPERQAHIKKQEEERHLVAAFRDWERRACEEVATLCRGTRKVLGKIRNEADLYKFGPLYHSLETYQYHLEVLTSGDDDAKFELWRCGYYG